MFLGDFDRPNLIFEVKRKSSNFDEAMCEIRNLIPPPLTTPSVASSSHDKAIGRSGNAIVYCFSQKECVTVSNALVEKGEHEADQCYPCIPLVDMERAFPADR